MPHQRIPVTNEIEKRLLVRFLAWSNVSKLILPFLFVWESLPTFKTVLRAITNARCIKMERTFGKPALVIKDSKSINQTAHDHSLQPECETTKLIRSTTTARDVSARSFALFSTFCALCSLFAHVSVVCRMMLLNVLSIRSSTTIRHPFHQLHCVPGHGTMVVARGWRGRGG